MYTTEVKEKIEQSEKALRSRIERIEANASDLVFDAHMNRLINPRKSNSAPKAFEKAVLENRTVSYLGNIYGLKEYIEELCVLKGIDKKEPFKFCDTSSAITLCGRLKNTDTHGPKYSGKKVELEYRIQMFQQQGNEPKPDDLLIGEVFLITDENGDLHQADIIAKEAMRDWRLFLKDKLGMTIDEHRPLEKGKSMYSAKLPPELIKYVKKQKGISTE